MTVYLVGAGPGDPGLLTLRGAELLAKADVVIYDRLSVADLLDLAPAGAELISVGKTPGGPTVPQERINELLIEHGRVHPTVVRLKGGDPFVFARGAEECLALAEAGIGFEVVPGITSAIAAPASGGIPVTMRYSSTAFTVITGHEDPTKDTSIDWQAVAKVGGTIVILMGVGRWPRISAALLAGGLSPDTPAAAVQWGTRPEQRTTRATLATLGDHHLESPSAIVIGAVAGVDVGWFEQRPLFGRTIVVTRTRTQASTLAESLRLLGAAVVQIPTIEIVGPADDGRAMADAVERLAATDWVVCTSPNGAHRFCAALHDARDLGGVRVAAIGPGTAAAFADHAIVADLVPDRYVAEGLLDAFPAPPRGGGRVLIARAAEARDVLPDGLRDAGWDVEVVAAYRTVAPTVSDDDRAALGSADTITFTSSSTVTNFVAAFGIDAVPDTVACIGPITAATARDLGITVTVESGVHTVDGLVAALVEHAAAAPRPARPTPRPSHDPPAPRPDPRVHDISRRSIVHPTRGRGTIGRRTGAGITVGPGTADEGRSRHGQGQTPLVGIG